MKYISKFLVIAILSLGFASCNFLDENMDTKYTTEQIYGSEEALDAALTGCYRLFCAAGFRSGTMLEWFEPASAISHWGGQTTRLTDGQKRWVCSLYLTRFQKNPNNISNFKSFYYAVYECNKLIAELKTSSVKEEYKAKIDAEARFVRAQSYFYLTRIWGNVALTTEPATDIQSTNKPRSPFWEIYGQILSDLDIAEKNMFTYDELKAARHLSDGRVCNYGATAAKSIVYLTIGTLLSHANGDNFWTCADQDVWDGFKAIGIGNGDQASAVDAAFKKALECAKTVIPEDNAASPYQLASYYSDLYKWTDTEDYELRERIFVLPSTNEVGGSVLSMWLLPANYMDSGKGASATNSGRFRPSRFLFQTWCSLYGGVKGTSAGENDDIYVKCGDPRIDAALIYGSYQGASLNTVNIYPTKGCIYTADEYKIGAPYFKKYYDPKYDYTSGNADLYLIRLAEIYLVAAEAEANLGNCAEACKYVNYVLARARKVQGKDDSAEPADWNITDKEELINRIFWERCFELSGEHHEYFDTHRMGAEWFSKNVTTPHNAFLAEKEQGPIEDEKTGEVTKIGYRSSQYGQPNPAFGANCIFPEDPKQVRKGLINAYPDDELIYNTALDRVADQNPEEVFWE